MLSRIVEAKEACVRGLRRVNAKAAAALVVATLAGAAMASPPPAPEMDPIVLPVDAESVTAQIGLIGGTVMLLVFALVIGFAIAWKLFRRAKQAV